MSTYNIKATHDLPQFMPVANNFANETALAGCAYAYDKRQGLDRHPLAYFYNNNNDFMAFNPVINGHIKLSGSAPTGSGGSTAIFVPSAGPNGTVAAGCTTTSIVVSTAFPAAVGTNSLANRGDGTGFKIRIIGNASGSSGKTEEAYIIANTAGTTPTLTLGSTLSFSPANGDRYELLSGRVFILSTSGGCKYWDVACHTFSSALTVTNYTTGSSDSFAEIFDELYVPYGKTPGQGFFGNLTATATGSTSLTGGSSAADASLQANEYANFQIRIVQDTGTPTSVGQRRKITSHTGANPTVYTISSAWTVTPSSTATYVIEGIGDLAFFPGSSQLICTYAAGGFRADGAWSTGATNGTVAALQIPNRPASGSSGGAGMWAFGLSSLDTAKNARYSAFYYIRGGGTASIDVLDIATLSWSTGAGGSDISYGYRSTSTTFSSGTCAAYDPIGNNGQYWYINQSASQNFYRFDVKNRILVPWNYLRQAQGTAVTGARMFFSYAYDGSTYGPYLHIQSSSLATLWRCLTMT